ncbi:5-formyltetrahydrofolate cyclo-ligase [Sphaerospermopsis kisseleviana CS-549]|uniref:5-formyltetrahydrofolate cyclo-ligase n=1 Tax=Sphaerospermopsis kisseleviana CS-549 TaxID=3021783 RepID=A0ABT4ZMP2_9CYAN|nr:5-formyltetrahydrofolate cyclo-ligase [Sphaerospermopsis kisseleviana]MDB9440658.1 5-formyltetrahydrofolate cyclo-ligase [Sphaerospermopsis kisseleviana CS-549]
MLKVDSQLNKTELRRSLLRKRQSMTVQDWQKKSDRISSQLQNSPLFTQATTILAYFSFRQEPDLSPLFTDSQRSWGFPRCVGESLSWHLWQPDDIPQTGNYGITEPHPEAPTIDPTEVDLILVPSVACDRQGYRLGYGGGYYDRLLSSPVWSKIPTIGVVFDFAYFHQLPFDNWDKCLQGVITESQIYIR